jgi:serine/threonine-protein kinase
MLGQVLGGRYRVLRVLGAGSFGQTYLAADQHRPDHPNCVVKHLKPAVKDLNFLPIARDLFKKEAITLEKLGSHDQIPRLLAYFEENQEFYLVQEFIEGHLLRTELSGMIWDEMQVLQMLQEVLSILEFVHHYGVIHRDVKPDNLIRRHHDGKLVLIDFGAVKQIQQLPTPGKGGHLTIGTIAIGTPGYMPPEQSQGRPRPNSDLYALGMIAIQSLTGRSPTHLQQNARGEVDWLKQVHISEGLAAILCQMVRYHFQERYQSATEVLQALEVLSRKPRLLQRMGKLLRTPIGQLVSPKGSPPLPEVNPAQAVPPAIATPTSLPPPPSQPQRVVLPPPVPSDATPGLGSTVERGYPRATRSAKVFISYRDFELERTLAQQFYQALQSAGHEPWMTGQNFQLEEGWAQRIDAALRNCDYFLLLLSPTSANSELVLEEVRTVKALRAEQGKPVILPVRLNFPLSLPLNYELRGYLHRIQQRFWRTDADTTSLVQEILDLLSQDTDQSDATGTEEPSGGLRAPTVPPVRPKSDAPPLPVAEPELPEGQMSLGSAFYVERPPIEPRCFETILQPGALIRIKAPRQMGKTSLMARILHQASLQGYASVSLSLQLADARIFTDLDKFLRWLCVSIGRRLQLTNQLDQYWDEIFGSKYNCTAYFEEYLLTEIATPLALGLDEVDRVFGYPEIASDFFGLLRAWHEEAKNREIWQKLRLVVVHSTEVYIPLNTNQSPFNVGLPIELPEFNAQQVMDLAQLYGLNWSITEVERLMAMVGGHPYLVRLAMYHIANQDVTLEQLLRAAPTEGGLFRDHLHGHLWNLQQHPELADAFRLVLGSATPIPLEATALFKLHSLGLVSLEGNQVKPRCDLYRQYFRFTDGKLGG